MSKFIAPSSLYTFLKYCNQSQLEKTVLDCGAGGNIPPLYIFHEFGYQTCGIEICDEQLKKARDFCLKHHVDLNIIKGDMTKLDFDDESFSFLFSYNTSVHMHKKEFLKALKEFNRVLKVDGLCFVNFLTKECDTYNLGKELDKGEFLFVENDEKILFSHYEDKEIENYFFDFKIIYKEKRIVKRIIDNKEYVSGYLDYILQKV